MSLLERLYISGNIERPDRGQLQPAPFSPRKELDTRSSIGTAGVRVADIGGEKFDVALGGRVAGVGDQRRHQVAVGERRERGRLLKVTGAISNPRF
jgi:hypothetical protein